MTSTEFSTTDRPTVDRPAADRTARAPRRHRSVAVAATATMVALAGVAAAGGALTAAAAAPHHLTIEQIDARVARSTVQLEIDYTAYVSYPTVSGTWVRSKQPVESSWACSGWFVDSTGDIVTAGHCVDPVDSRADVIDAYIQQLKQDPSTGVTDAWIEQNQAVAEKQWRVEGEHGGTNPDQAITAFQSKTLQGALLAQPVAANVIAFRPFAREDVALLNVDARSVGLPVATGSPAVGASVTLVGFPVSVQEVSASNTLEASFKSGTISSRQTNENGVAKLEVNADISGGMSGGPAIDAAGRVVGINSFEIDGESKDFNFVTDTDSLHSFLAREGVRPAPRFDRFVDRDAVDAVAAAWRVVGEIVLLLGGAAVSVLALVGRRRRTGGSTGASPKVSAAVSSGSSETEIPVQVSERPRTFPTAPVPPVVFTNVVASEAVRIDSPAQRDANGVRCADGHGNLPGGRFCATCGLPLETGAPVREYHLV